MGDFRGDVREIDGLHQIIVHPALKEAFAITDRPSVIVVPIDYSENMKLTKRLGQLLPH